LPPGNYFFHVIACNNDGVWNQRGVIQAFTLRPFFWQTRWFFTVSVLSAIALVLATVWFAVMRRLHRKLERLEGEQMVERERARIAKDIHDDLGASLTEITILSELALNSGARQQDAQADIRKISVKSRTLTQLLDEIVWAVNPKRDTLENFVTYSCTYAEEYLRVAGIPCRLQLPAAVQAVTLRATIRHGLFLAVKETLNNIVKHAAATEVQLSVEIQPDGMVIGIRDNGRGFRTDSPAAGGEGLDNIRQRVESLGGRLEITSEPGQGTLVRMSVPIRK